MTEPPRTLQERLRDFDARPYSPDEARVAAFFAERGSGGGDDPIGAILAGYAWVVSECNTAQEAIKIQSQLLAEAREALDEIERKYQRIMQQPPDWTTFTDENDERLKFAREAWYGASLIARAVLAKLKAATSPAEGDDGL